MRPPVSAVLTVAGITACLCGCATNTTTGAIVTKVDSASTTQRYRESGAAETTLAAFCKNPPHAATPEGAQGIKASCSRRVLRRAGNARVFDKGDGLYHVVFAKPIRNGEICDKETPPQSLCGYFAAGDKMRSSRIVAE